MDEIDASALTDTTRPPAASVVVAACEEAWRAIQRRHPEVPDAIQVLGSGVERGRLVKLGHWWGGRWVADGEVRGEVLRAGEALNLMLGQVFEILLHEAAHGLNAARGIKDTSRGGRYHNARYQATAQEVGLAVEQMPPYGWAKTELTPAAVQRYLPEIERLGEAMRIARRLEREVRLGTGDTTGAGRDDTGASGGDRQQPKQPPATCGCGRKMRMAPSVLAQGPVLCGLCGQDFTVDRAAQRTSTRDLAAAPNPGPADAPVDNSFLQRRSAELAAEARRREPDSPSRMGHPSRFHELTPLQRQGLAEVHRLTKTPADTEVLDRVHVWFEAQRRGDPTPLIGTSAEDVAAANAAARSVLKLVGMLSGPPVELPCGEVRGGDQVMMTGDPHAWDPAQDLPSPGMVGTVERVDVDRGEIEVDFAIAGIYRFVADEPTAARLTYGYAEPADQVGAPLVDLRDLPPRAPEPEHLADVVELTW